VNRFLTCGIVAAACVVLGAAQPSQPTFRGTTDIVRVFVTVTDRDGRLVTTLNRNDFAVRDDGKPQDITTFDNTPQPIRLIVMLDCSGSMSGNLQLLRASAEQLFVRLRGDDSARVGSFGHDVTISSEFTHNPDALQKALPESIAPDAPTPLWRAINEALDGFQQRGSSDSADGDGRGRDRDRPREVERDQFGRTKQRANSGSGSTASGEQASVGPNGERPVILVLSDGKDSGPIDFRQRYVSQVEIIDRARAEGVMIYGIGMRSRSARPQQPGIGPGGMMATLVADMPDPGLAKVAEETGGGYAEVRYGQDLGAAFARVADELHSQYLIGYAPPRKDGKKHDIDVRVTQRGMEPRARKNYVAAKS
jgi:Ca-activated chloride channel family protein